MLVETDLDNDVIELRVPARPHAVPNPATLTRRACDSPTMGSGPCSFPSCSGGGGFRPCTGFTGTAQDCNNCSHDYSYHA